MVLRGDVLTVIGASCRLHSRGIDSLPGIRAGIDQPDA